MKKLIALALSVTMCAALLAGCGNTKQPAAQTEADSKAPVTEAQTSEMPETPVAETAQTEAEPKSDVSVTDPINDIAGKYYSYYYYPDTDFLMDYFFHFYDEVPGVGKVYYAGFCINQITYTGTYEVKEEEIEYACWPDRETQDAAGEGAEPPTGTAPYTIYFYDMSGNLVDSCGYDGTNLYMDMENISGIGGDANVFTLDTDPENSVMANDYAGEAALAIKSFVSPDDETATLDLLVNGKYNDMVIMAADGTYAGNADMSEITLTSSDGSADAKVTLNEDGTYTYTAADGTEVILAESAQNTKNVLYSFVGEVPVPGMEGTNGDLICDFYDDGTARVYASAMGQEFDLDAGTYEVDMTTYTITAQFDKAGELATYATDDGMSIDYAQTGAEVFGDVASTLSMLKQ